jgi:hypothetical protein
MAIFHVNVAAPYLLTAHIHRPRRTTSDWATARRNGWPPAITRRPWPARRLLAPPAQGKAASRRPR